MKNITITIINHFGQEELRKAQVVHSVDDIPVGCGKIGVFKDYTIWADRAPKMIEFAKRIYAVK